MLISLFAGLRPRLMLQAFLVALPFIGLSLFMFAERRQHVINDVQEEVLQLTGSLVHLQEHLSEETLNSLDLNWLNELLAPGAAFTVIDQNGTILARYPEPQPWVGQTAALAPLIEAALAHQGEGTAEVEDLDGIRRLYAFARLRSAPGSGVVYVSVGIPAEDAFADANALLARDLLAFAVINLVALSLAWFGGDVFIRRYVRALLRAAQQWKAGDLRARTGLDYRMGEPGQLAQAFDEMAAALQQRENERQRAEEALRQSQMFLVKAQEVARVGNWISGPGKEIGDQAIWSREVFEILGLDEAKFDGKLSTFYSLVHPDDLEAVKKADQEAAANHTPYDIEHRIIRPDGTVRWIHSRGEVIQDEYGEPLRWIGVVQDITERKQTEETLQRYAAELEQRVAERTAELQAALRQEKQLSELKARFSSMVTHEFRNPLAAIQLSSDVLKKFNHKLTDDKRLEHVERIQTRVKYLVELLDDILTISKADTVGLEFHPEPLNLDTLCRQIIEDIQPATSSAPQIVFSDDSHCAEINGDEKLLRQMVTNLLSNALKYSPDGSVVQVGLRCEVGHAVLRVTDQGIGIPEADLKRLFEVFHRAKNAAGIPGTGLGLAIAKRAAEAHGGTITVESKVGVGSTFTVWLPLMNSTS